MPTLHHMIKDFLFLQTQLQTAHAFTESTSACIALTFSLLRGLNRGKKEEQVNFVFRSFLQTEIIERQAGKAAVYLRSGWPAMSPDLHRWFW